MALIKSMIGKPSVAPKQIGLCMEWSRKCMAAVIMKTVLFTDGIMHEDDA